MLRESVAGQDQSALARCGAKEDWRKKRVPILWVICVMHLRRYVGNINLNVTEQLLAEVFSTCGSLSNCKLIKKEKVRSPEKCAMQVFIIARLAVHSCFNVG